MYLQVQGLQLKAWMHKLCFKTPGSRSNDGTLTGTSAIDTSYLHDSNSQEQPSRVTEHAPPLALAPPEPPRHVSRVLVSTPGDGQASWRCERIQLLQPTALRAPLWSKGWMVGEGDQGTKIRTKRIRQANTTLTNQASLC